MEPNEFYVYKSGYFICGGCGSSLSPQQFDRRPYRPRVACFNPPCPKYLVILQLGDEARVPAFDTGERAPDPRVTQQVEIGAQPGVQAGNARG